MKGISRGRRRLPPLFLLVLGLGSCLQYDFLCGSCIDKITEPPPVPFERVGPCTIRYYNEPKEPGLPGPRINGITTLDDEIDFEHHLITFKRCDTPDAGIDGEIELVWIYSHSPVEH